VFRNAILTYNHYLRICNVTDGATDDAAAIENDQVTTTPTPPRTLDQIYAAAVSTLSASVSSGLFQEVLLQESVRVGSNITAAATVSREQVVVVTAPVVVPPEGLDVVRGVLMIVMVE
jgi:hypothetical protein